MAEYGIKLRRYAIAQANHWYLRAFRLRIEVAEVHGAMSRYVFLYSRHPANAVTGVIEDRFETVASAVDLAEYPVGAPDSERPHPFFRTDSVELDVRSSEDYEEVWTRIQNEVCQLATILKRMENLEVVEEVWCGDQPESGSSDSDSEAASESASESASASAS